MGRPLSLLFLLATTTAGAQPPWQWATRLGGHSFVNTDRIVPDSIDGCTVSGVFLQDLVLPWDTLQATTGSGNGFIAHLNYTGTPQWAVRTSAPVLALEARAGGGVRVLMTSAGDCIIGDSTFNLEASGLTIIRADLAVDGTLIGTLVLGGALQWPGSDGVSAAAIGPNGEVAVSGVFTDSLLVADTALYGPAGSAYLARFAPDGQLVRAQRLTHVERAPASVGIDGALDTWLCGVLPDMFDGPDTLLGTHGCVLARFDASGELLWRYNTEGTDLTPDSDPFFRILPEGDAVLGYSMFSGPNGLDLRVVRSNAEGGMVWSATAYGVTSFGQGVSCAPGRNGDVLVGGYTAGGLDFGEGPVGGAGNPDCFVASIGSTGDWQWATSDAGAGNVYGAHCAEDPFGRIFITGTFEFMARFGPLAPLTSNGPFTSYVACLSDLALDVGGPHEDQRLRTWPVPARDRLHVQLPTSAGTLRITDLSGRVVEQAMITGPFMEVDITRLAAGPYLLSQGTCSARFVKE